MDVIIMNAAPGVGKTTILKLLENKLSNGFAIIDGDDVGRTIPLENTLDWLNLIQDNIVACAKNFKEHDIKTLIVSFVFPSKERLQRIVSLLEKEENNVYHIKLICEPEILKKRIKRRNNQKLLSIHRALECNAEIKKINADYCIDTTQKSPDQVMNIVVDGVAKLTDRKEKN